MDAEERRTIGRMGQVKQPNIRVNSVLNVVKTLSSILFPLITFPYVSRVLQPENIGKINFGSSFVSYFSLIATLGITTYAIRECAAVREDKELLGKRASEIFSINICTTIVAYIFLAISLLIFKEIKSYKTLIIVQSTAILFTTLGTDWLNTAMEDFVYITIRTLAFQFVSLALMFLLVRTPDDYVKYAAISVMSSSGANLLNIYYRKKYCQVSFITDMQWKKHFKPILLLFVMILAQTIFSSADVTMLGLMRDDYEVGIYTTAHKIEGIIAQVVSSLAWVVMPRMSSYFAAGDYEKINNLLRKVFAVLTFIGLPAISGTIAIANEIVLFVGGSSYYTAAMPLSIFMASFGFSLVGGSFLGNMVLLPSGKEKIYMHICCIATVINVILNFFLIKRWGAVAAAATTSFCSFLMMLMMLVTKDKRIKLNYVGEVLWPSIVGSILIYAYCKLMVVLFSGLWMKLSTCILGSVIIYVLTSIVLKNEVLNEVCKVILRKMKRDV